MLFSCTKPAAKLLRSFKKGIRRGTSSIGVLSKQNGSRCSIILDQSFTRRLCGKPECSTEVPAIKEENVTQTSSNTTACGQPTCFTHPHFICEGEVVPGIKLEEFLRRRSEFMKLIFGDSLSTYGIRMHHMVVIPAASKVYMSEKIPYIFHQNTDFLYLSGCLEPDTALVLSGSCENDLVSTIFLRSSDQHSQKWDGPRTGIDIAPRIFGVDEAYYVADLPKFLSDSVRKNSNYLFYYDLQSCSASFVHSTITKYVQQYNITSCRSWKCFIDQLRLIKSPGELNLMKRAALISSAAIQRAMEVTQPGISEHQLFATVDYESRMRGAEILAYPPVVASGKNANIIHYINNNQVMQDGELVLMDAGCEYRNYCADITRTWPVNGKFTNYQRILYEVVLDIQKQIVSSCEEKLSLDLMFQKMIRLLGEYLQKEKIIKVDVCDSSTINEIANSLCPHHVSHYLGMDVHDVRTISKNIRLEPGMVITVEPGIYTNVNPRVRPEFWNIGIRIEDDVVITDTGYEILSAKCPKEVLDIENVMRR